MSEISSHVQMYLEISVHNFVANKFAANIVINKGTMNKSTKKYNYYFNTKPFKETQKEFG